MQKNRLFSIRYRYGISRRLGFILDFLQRFWMLANKKTAHMDGVKFTIQILFFLQSNAAPIPAAYGGQNSNPELYGMERQGVPKVS